MQISTIAMMTPPSAIYRTAIYADAPLPSRLADATIAGVWK